MGTAISLHYLYYFKGSPCSGSALIRGAGGEQWRLAVRWSLKALQLLLADKFLDMPCPLSCPAAWELLWRGTPGAWPRLLALARRRAEEEPSRAYFVLTQCPLLAPALADPDELSQDDFLCGAPGCSATSKSLQTEYLASLTPHMTSPHAGQASWASRSITCRS